MNIFKESSYRNVIRLRLRERGKRDGKYSSLAKHLRILGSQLSQVMSGDRHLTSDQAYLVCDYFSFSELETEYFFVLLEHERSVHFSYRTHLETKLKRIRERSEKLSERISKEKILDEATQAIFYSQWYYSAIRQVTAIPGFQAADQIASRLGLPRKLVARVVEFLLENGLSQMNQGKLEPSVRSTHVDAGSPLVARHHINWRMKAMESFHQLRDSELVFTGPATLSRADMKNVRSEIQRLIESWVSVVDHSQPETLACLNIDWVAMDSHDL